MCVARIEVLDGVVEGGLVCLFDGSLRLGITGAGGVGEWLQFGDRVLDDVQIVKGADPYRSGRLELSTGLFALGKEGRAGVLYDVGVAAGWVLSVRYDMEGGALYGLVDRAHVEG